MLVLHTCASDGTKALRYQMNNIGDAQDGLSLPMILGRNNETILHENIFHFPEETKLSLRVVLY